jgi:hypothetical protein
MTDERRMRSERIRNEMAARKVEAVKNKVVEYGEMDETASD